MNALSLEVAVDEEAGASVVRLAGELDLMTVGEADVRLAEAGGERVVVDLTDLTFLDSAAVHLLFRMVRRFRDEGRRLAFVVPASSPTHRIVEILDLSSAAPVRASVAEALEATR